MSGPKKKILVTGASGLLGLNFALQSCETYEIVGVVNRNRLHDLPFATVQRDFFVPGTAAALVDEIRPDAILNCAAMANIDSCEQNPEDARWINGMVPGFFAEAAGKRSIPIVHISTDAVFDGQASGPNGYSETDPVRPINSYAESKALGERNVLSANPDAIVARVNFFGWSISGRRSLSEFFYTNLKDGRVVSGFKDVFFSPLYVRDLSRILVRLLESSERGVFHVFGARALSKYDFGVEIAKAFGFNPENVRPTSWRDSGLAAVRSPNLAMNIDRLTKFLDGNVPDPIAGVAGFRDDFKAGFPIKLWEHRWN